MIKRMCMLAILLLVPSVSLSFTIEMINDSDVQRGCAIEYTDLRYSFKPLNIAYATLEPKESFTIDREDTYGKYIIIWYKKDNNGILRGKESRIIVKEDAKKVITRASNPENPEILGEI